MEYKILAIESSCDETAAAVYTTKSGILSSVLFSQIDLQKEFGGVVPEIASRSHLEKITLITQQALNAANINLDEIDVIAVTTKPGLPGSLIIGTCFAKTIAWVKQKKIIGINHLEGHAYSAFIENKAEFPTLCLTASGGHTSLYLLADFGQFEIIGQTLDDAAGEAFDKIAKFIGLGYPGGPIIEKLAESVQFKDFYNYPRGQGDNLNFSFSGLKTAVLYDLVEKNIFDIKTKKLLIQPDEQLQKEVASSLLVCVGDIFKQKINLALKKHPEIKTVSFVGGVACNKYLRNEVSKICKINNVQFFTPSAKYCTDNAAMIAFVGHYRAKKGLFDNYSLDIL